MAAGNRRRRRLRRRRRPAPRWAPEPPVALPPGRAVHLPGRGETFFRDTGGDGPPVLLLHGWVVSADLNWYSVYEPLAAAGYRVLAIDHRGHGRGLRTHQPFQLADCAADAAALLELLETEPAFAVGYSMGGTITQLMARDHPHALRGIVLCATTAAFRDPRQRATWNAMGLARLTLGMAPQGAWRAGLRRLGLPDTPVTTWISAELTRGSSVDLAEAGREMSRFDSRAWLGSLETPAAVVVMTEDVDVPARRQRQLAELLGAPAIEVAAPHIGVAVAREQFVSGLLEALEAAGARPAGRPSAARASS